MKKAPNGRPTKYRAEYARMAFRHCLLGATDESLAELFETTHTTINFWKQKHPRFLASIRKGKIGADEQIAESLYGRATGYTHDDVDIRTTANGDGTSSIVQTKIKKHYPPDVQAQKFWLNNRRRKDWGNGDGVSVSVNQAVVVDASKPVEQLTVPQLKSRLAEIEEKSKL